MTALCIIGGVLLFFVWLFTRKLHIGAGFADDPFLYVRILFLKLRLPPEKAAHTEENPKEQTTEKGRKKKAKKEKEKAALPKKAVGEYITIFTDALKELVHKLKKYLFLEKYIISKGIEVVPPLLAPFFLQEFVNVEVQKHLRLSCSHVPDFVVRGAYQTLIGTRIRRINKAAGKFRYFRPFSNIYDDAKEVDGIVSLAAQFGEGWLLPADIIGYLRDGITNVISLQPFGCIANHVVSKGIEKRLHEKFPELNLVSLDFDSGVSAVNVTNRLLLFLDSIAV